MPIEPPPTRYKVVERGRRLEVIDTWAEGPPERSATDQPIKLADSRGFEAGPALTLVTQRWFDDQAPRRIRVGQQGQSQLVVAAILVLIAGAFLYALFDWIVLLPIGFLLVQPRIWRGVRALLTAWLTALDQSDTGSSAG